MRERGLLSIEKGRVAFESNHFEGTSLFNSIRTLLDLHPARADFFRCGLLFELRYEDSIVELPHLEGDFVLGLIDLDFCRVDVGSCGAIGLPDLEHLCQWLSEAGSTGIGSECALVEE